MLGQANYVCDAADSSLAPKARESRVIFEDNHLFQNNLCGIRIAGDLPCIIRTSDIHTNGNAGIILEKRAAARIITSRIHKNLASGIRIGNVTNITIDKVRIFSNYKAGVSVEPEKDDGKGSSNLTITNTRIYANGQAGIRSLISPVQRLWLNVSDSQIYANHDAGIRLQNETILAAGNNRIYQNGSAGILVSEDSTPAVLDIWRNHLCFNQGPGIFAVNGKGGQSGIRANWIYGNLRSGIVLGLIKEKAKEVGRLLVTKNVIVSNGSAGKGCGVRWGGKGRVLIQRNVIAYNVSSGIRVDGCKGYSHNLLFANGKAARCCDDPYNAPFWIEIIQYGGCGTRGEGGLITDPMFVDPDAYDFHLKDGSPAMDLLYEENGLP